MEGNEKFNSVTKQEQRQCWSIYGSAKTKHSIYGKKRLFAFFHEVVGININKLNRSENNLLEVATFGFILLCETIIPINEGSALLLTFNFFYKPVGCITNTSASSKHVPIIMPVLALSMIKYSIKQKQFIY